MILNQNKLIVMLVNINHMNNSYLFFKKPKPNKPTKQLIANSNKSITAKLNHSLSASSNHSNYNKSQSKIKKQNIVLTKRQREIRDAIQYRFQKSKLKKFSYNCYANKRQQNLRQIQCQSSNSSQEQEFKTMKKLTIVNLYQYHENKLRYQNKRNKQDQKYRQKLVYQKNARQKSYQKNVRQKSYQKNKRQQSQSPTTKNVQSRFKIKSNVKSDNSNNSLNKNIRSIKDIYMNSILSLANKNTVKNQHNKNYLSQKKNDLSLKQKINKIEKLDKTAKNASDWKSIFVKLKDSKSSLKDNKNIYSYRQNIKSPKTNKYLIEHGTVNTTQYAKNVKSFKNINYSEQRKKGDLYKVKKQEKNIQLDIDSDQQYGEERLKKNLNQLKKQHSKQIKKILQRQYKGDIKYK